MLKVVAAATIAFGLPPAIFFIASTALTDPDTFGRYRGGMAGHLLFLAVNIAAPGLGFGFIARPFQRWTELNRQALFVCIGLAALYWTIYLPTMIVGIIGALACWSGCDS
jgi:hypothetical protein